VLPVLLSAFVIPVEILNRPVIGLFAGCGKEASRYLPVSTVIGNAFAAFAVPGT